MTDKRKLQAAGAAAPGDVEKNRPLSANPFRKAGSPAAGPRKTGSRAMPGIPRQEEASGDRHIRKPPYRRPDAGETEGQACHCGNGVRGFPRCGEGARRKDREGRSARRTHRKAAPPAGGTAFVPRNLVAVQKDPVQHALVHPQAVFRLLLQQGGLAGQNFLVHMDGPHG